MELDVLHWVNVVCEETEVSFPFENVGGYHPW